MKILLEDSLNKLSIEYDEEKLSKLENFYELTVEKNKVMNLTAITDPEEFIIKHFVDSLAVLNFISFSPGMKAADLGTGGGFPGIPLAIFHPEVNFILIDSVNKKLNFISEAAAKLGISNVETLHGRAEDIAHLDEHRENYDYVFSRAVSNMSSLSELALGLVKLNGLFVAYKSDNSHDEIRAAANALKLMGGTLDSENNILLPNSDIKRYFYFIKKSTTTPKKYPRKPGEPARRPL